MGGTPNHREGRGADPHLAPRALGTHARRQVLIAFGFEKQWGLTLQVFITSGSYHQGL